MLFVTGTDTGVGKTQTTTVLLQQLQQLGFHPGAYKPVCSGAESDTPPAAAQTPQYFWSDVRRLQQACSLPATDTDICPQRFLAPLAPNVAAAEEGRTVDDDLLSRGLDVWKTRCDLMLIEGAGGLYCPLSNKSTVLDLVRRLNCPAVVVAGNRLGVISHTRMTVELLRLSGCHVAGIILNEISPPAAAAEDLSKSSNARQLQTWLPRVPLLHLGWNGHQLQSADPQQSADDWLRQTATAASRCWQSWISKTAGECS